MSEQVKKTETPKVVSLKGYRAQLASRAAAEEDRTQAASSSRGDAVSAEASASVVAKDCGTEGKALAPAEEARASSGMFTDVVGDDDRYADDEVDYEESDEMRSEDDDRSPPRASTPAVKQPRLQPAQSSGTLAAAIRASSTSLTRARSTPSSSVGAASPAVRVKSEARAGMTASSVVATDEGPLPVGPYVPSWTLDPRQREASDPLYPWPLFAMQGPMDDDFVHEMRFDPRTDDRNRFYIDLFYQYRYCNLKRNNTVPALLQAWNAFVKNYNDDTQGFVRRLRDARERYERHSFRGKLNRIHSECMRAGIPCGVPEGLECAFCAPDAERISPEGFEGYKNFVVPHAVKDLIYGVLGSNVSSSEEGKSAGARECATRIPSASPARPPASEPFVPTLRAWEGNLSNELDTDDLSHQYHELAEPSCAPGSLARSSAARLARPPAAVELSHEVREHAAAVVGLREENRRILMSQVSASERAERLLSRLERLSDVHERLREDHDRLREDYLDLLESHQTLQSDYRGLLADLTEHEIHRGDARRHRAQSSASSAPRKT
ncbi:hypothetical protein FI667_g15584, partial [Globisporangium splendens]